MSCHLTTTRHLPSLCFAMIGSKKHPDETSGTLANLKLFKRSHDNTLAPYKLGYTSNLPTVWIPNSPKPAQPGLISRDKHSNLDAIPITKEYIETRLTWFREAFATELATLVNLYLSVETHFGCINYSL